MAVVAEFLLDSHPTLPPPSPAPSRPSLAQAGVLPVIVPLAAGYHKSVLMLARKQALKAIDVPKLPEPRAEDMTGAQLRRQEELRRRSRRVVHLNTATKPQSHTTSSGDDSSDSGTSSDGGVGAGVADGADTGVDPEMQALVDAQIAVAESSQRSGVQSVELLVDTGTPPREGPTTPYGTTPKSQALTPRPGSASTGITPTSDGTPAAFGSPRRGDAPPRTLSQRKMPVRTPIKRGVNALLQSPSVQRYLEQRNLDQTSAGAGTGAGAGAASGGGSGGGSSLAARSAGPHGASSSSLSRGRGAGGAAASGQSGEDTYALLSNAGAGDKPRRTFDLVSIMRRRDEAMRLQQAVVQRARFARRQTAVALCNMACDVENHEELLRLGAMPAWIDLCAPSAYVCLHTLHTSPHPCGRPAHADKPASRARAHPPCSRVVVGSQLHARAPPCSD